MNPKVSILVPVYKVSDFIEKCAHSLFLQTFGDIEYIFVDDCSPDDSIEKLRKVISQYPHREKSVKILLHQQNEGVIATCATALNASSGEYISTVASDDFVEPDFIESLYNAVKEANADIAVCDVWKTFPSEREYLEDYIPENKDDLLFEIIKTDRTQCFFANKLIRRSFYLKEDCRVPADLKYLTDRYAMPRIYYYTNKIVKVNKPLYHYVQYNPHAITKSKTEQHFKSMIYFWEQNDAFFREKNIYEKYRDLIEFCKVETKIRLLIDVDSYALRKKYAYIFRDFEMKYIDKFRRGEKITLFLIHHKLYLPAHLFVKTLRYKNRKS